MSATATAELVTNTAGRRVPSVVNGREQTPYAGVDGHRDRNRLGCVTLEVGNHLRHTAVEHRELVFVDRPD